MPRNKLSLAVAIGLIFFAFGYGVLVGKYSFPPYIFIKQLKQFVAPSIRVSGRSAHYLHKKSFFEAHGRGDYDVVFVGDSITRDGDWYELFPEVKAANRGIGEDTASGILNRVDSVLSTNAEKAFIMVGINDLQAGVTVDDIFFDYERIVDALLLSGMVVYVQSTLYRSDVLSAPLIAKITELNKLLADLPKRKEDVFFIDLNSSLSEGDNLKSSYTSDGLHLNGSAYGKWRDSIHPMVIN